MKYCKLIIVMTAIVALCSCGKNQTTDSPQTESVTSTTSMSDVAPTEIVTETSTAIKVTTSVNLLKDSLSDHEFCYIFDFDMDGTFEIIVPIGDLAGGMTIEKIIDNEILPIGDIQDQPPYELYTVPCLTLYYDKANDEYFYVTEYVLNEKIEWGVYAGVNKYVFKDNKIIKTKIAYCEFRTVGTDYSRYEFTLNKLFGEDNTPIGIVKRNEITHLYDGVEEYLSEFEKIKEIPYEELTAIRVGEVINSGKLSEYFPDVK